jgi:trehalose-phosphatase
MKALREQVRENDIYKWVHDITLELAQVWNLKENRASYVFDDEVRFRTDLAGKEVFLFLDYDGTLAPIAESPEKAAITHTMHCLVSKLADRLPVAIVSGRGVDDVQQRLGLENIVYAGNHGAEIRARGESLVSGQSGQDRRALEDVLARLRSVLASFCGAIIEDKGLTASVHYRLVDPNRLAEMAVLFRNVSREYEDRFRFTSGKKVFEIRPKGAWHKGDAVSWILDNLGRGKSGVYIGDDVTDEDAFRALKGRGISISVGGSAHADYYLRKQEEVERLLEHLVTMTETSS